ncbi:MAG: aldo/keto reductase [Ferruginibacter sp.]
MNYRKFGSTDLLVSEIGFGAWAIGGGAMIGKTAIGWGNSNDDESKKAIHFSLDAGINFFDTADIYGLGHSERLLGKLIGKDKELIIATKVGNVSRNEQFTVDYSKAYILKACEESLKRLQKDTIDYYQLHTARLAHLQEGECLDAMQQLQKEGKIRYWGISLNTFEPLPEANFFIQQQKAVGFQLVLNLINQTAIPVIKNADQLNLVGLTKQVNGLARAARNNKLKPDDTIGGTFTLTNVGTFGSIMGTPIINQPQVAIMAVGAIKKRPMVIETPQGDTIGIRHMMYISLSYDHRIIDGALGSSFLNAVSKELENFDSNRTF